MSVNVSDVKALILLPSGVNRAALSLAATTPGCTDPFTWARNRTSPRELKTLTQSPSWIARGSRVCRCDHPATGDAEEVDSGAGDVGEQAGQESAEEAWEYSAVSW